MQVEYKIYNNNYQNDSITLFKRWLENRNVGKTFADYCLSHGYMEVSIFDAGEIGKLVYEELKDSDIKVNRFFDRNAEGLGQIDGVPVCPLSDTGLMNADEIAIVSTIFDFTELFKYLVSVNPDIRAIYIRDAVYEF